MIRLALAALLLLSSAVCAPRRETRLQQIYDSGTSHLWRGELSDASKRVDEGAGAMGDPQSVWAWKFKLLSIEIKLVGRDVPDAAKALGEPPPRAAGFEWIAAKHRYLRGQLALLQGKPADATMLLDEAMQLADRVSADDVALDTGALKGQALMVQRRFGEAESILERTIARAQQRHDHYHEAVALVNMGTGNLLRDRFDQALQYFERVLAYKDLEPQLLYAVALSNSGICYYRLGQMDRAIDVQRRAVASHDAPGRPRVFHERALGELGNTYLVSGDVDSGIKYLTQATDVAKASGLKADAARWAANLSVAYLRRQQWTLAEQANVESRQLAENDAELSGNRTLSDAEIAFGRTRFDEATRLFKQTLAGSERRPSLQWSAHEGLARMAVARKQTKEAEREYAAALDVIERTRSELLKADYRLSFLTRLINFYQQYVDLLVDQGEADRALAIADSSRGRVLAERQGINAPARATPAALRRSAADLDAALLFYWIGESRSYVWCVTADRIRLVPLSLNTSQLGALVRAHQQSILSSISNPIAASSSPGDELYTALVAPVAPWIQKRKRVVIAPDGALSTLNFETLPLPGRSRHYWIEDVEIAIAPALGVLDRPAATDRANRAVLLIGDAVSADAKYPALRYAGAEMKAIASAFSDRASVYRADQATPARYLESQPGRFDIVHFTAHADANIESPLDSSVILSRGTTGYKLYARDVADRHLTADLVTISACRSAGERTYAGEGLVGFAWAFLRAGAKRVVAGLWDVDDRSTAELMGKMYAAMASGSSPGTALRDAKLAMIKAGGALSKPYYWAPFQLFIGSRVVP